MLLKMLLFPLIALGISWAIMTYLVPAILLRIGAWDSKFSFLIQFPASGEMYILVSGDGRYSGIIESVVDYDYEEYTSRDNPEGNHLFIEMSEQEKKREKNRKKGYLESMGLGKKPLWTSKLYREVKYDKWEKLEGRSEHGLVPKVRGKRDSKKPGERNPSIFFRYNMATKIAKVEIKGNIRIDAIVVFTVQLTNPVQAYFFAGGWESQVTAAVQEVFRNYAEPKAFEEIKAEKSDKTNSELTDNMKNLSGRRSGQRPDPDGLFALYGVEIVDVRFVEFDPVLDPKVLEAIQAEDIAMRQANADEQRGEGERRRRSAAAEGIRMEVAAWGSHPVGGTVAAAEAIKVAKPAYVGSGVFPTFPMTEDKNRNQKEEPEKTSEKSTKPE